MNTTISLAYKKLSCVFLLEQQNSVSNPEGYSETYQTSKSFIWGCIEIDCISLSNEFSTTVFHNLVEWKVKTENRFSTFAVAWVVNTEIFEFH